MIKFIIEVILFFIPRYVTNDVALAFDDNMELQVYCFKGHEELGDDIYIEAYGVIRSFTFLGFCSGGKCRIYKWRG